MNGSFPIDSEYSISKVGPAWGAAKDSCVCLLSRDPYRVRSGRTSVLRTAIDALASRFVKIDCVVFEKPSSVRLDGQRPHQCTFHYVGAPGLFRSPFGKAVRLISGQTLNEILFYDRKQMRATQRIIESGASLVYCDSLRLAQYASRLAVPWILDLDDLLSVRYRQIAKSETIEVAQILGHFGALVPKPLHKLLGMVVRPLLFWECRRLAVREISWAREADEVSLVSSDEAVLLGDSIGRTVRVLPMSVPDVDSGQAWEEQVWQAGRKLQLVFVGFLAYRPNLEALVFLAEQVVPALKRAGIEAQVNVVGRVDGVQIPDSVRSCKSIQLRGFVDDLHQEFNRNHAFIAPILSGTGVKTKVLEAMRFGIPVLGTPLAFSGLSLRRQKLLCWSDTGALIELLQQLGDTSSLREISSDGREFIQSHFSSSVIDARWHDTIASAFARPSRAA